MIPDSDAARLPMGLLVSLAWWSGLCRMLVLLTLVLAFSPLSAPVLAMQALAWTLLTPCPSTHP